MKSPQYVHAKRRRQSGLRARVRDLQLRLKRQLASVFSLGSIVISLAAL